MRLILASTGSYPRIGDSPELQTVRRTIAALDRGERTAADLADAENEMTRRAIEEQVRAGVELLTDGQIRWYDPLSHLAGKLEGVKIDGLLRLFDTNFYFRQPVVTSPPRRKAAMLVEEYRFACNALGLLQVHEARAGHLAVKAVLAGPYTLAKFSRLEDSAVGGLAACAEAYGEALAAELRALVEVGAEFIQIDEPAILKYPDDWQVYARAVEPVFRVKQELIRAGKRVRLALYVYFHNPAPLYEKLVQQPVDVLGLDFTYDPKLVDVVAAAGSPIPLALGLVDGRNTKLEDPVSIARQVEKMMPRIKGEFAFLGTSSGLEYLPRDRAYAKLTLLGKIRDGVTH